MIKKLCIFLTALMPLLANAQQAVGSWTFYPSFSTVTKIVESEEKVYYISAGALFSFDKETEERQSLNSTTGLNDMTISDIFYNPDGNYLLVCYDNGNMDKLYDNGKIVNLPDISTATLTEAPSVKDVAFGNDCFYVQTNFGIVNYDDRKNEVRATCYSTDIQSTMCIGDFVIANINDQLHYAPLTERVTSTDKFKPIPNYSVAFFRGKMCGTQTAGFFSHGPLTGYSVHRMTMNSDGTCRITEVTDPVTSQTVSGITNIVPNSDGSATLISKSMVYRVDAEGNVTRSAIPATLQGQVYSVNDGFDTFWCANSDGIGEYDITQNPEAVKHDRFLGSDLSVVNPRYLTPGQNGSFIITSRANDFWEGSYATTTLPFQMNILQNGKIANITPPYNSLVPSLTWGHRAVQNPYDVNQYFVAVWRHGLYRIDNNEYTGIYKTGTNAPWGGLSTLGETMFDNNGNLWVVVENEPLYVLPKDKLSTPADNITKDDWHVTPTGNGAYHRNARMMVCKKSNLIFISQSWYNGNIFTVCDTKGTADLSDDEFVIVEKAIDQDNNEFTNSCITFTEDNDGNVYVGGNGYVLNLGKAKFSDFSNTITANHVKIPRNDGTNLADYLCDGATIFDMTVDGANNKWLATSQGIFQVNASTDKILNHFTTDNSPMTTNKAYAVGVDPNSNIVWFAVDGGLLSYASSTSPGNDDYSEVLAYPNPVRPDYTGWITIKGLMNNSLVKIADAYGNVIVQGRSNGGMYLWDGCNSAGERVTSGVYHVFASQNENGTSGAVAKILIVN